MMMKNMLALLVSLFAMALSAPVQSKMVAVRKEDLGKTLAKLEAKVEEMVQEQGHVEKEVGSAGESTRRPLQPKE